MANWCLNTVWLTGEPDQVVAACRLFREIQSNPYTWQLEQFPEFFPAESNCFFDADLNEEVLVYYTRCVPNTTTLVRIAGHFQIGFCLKYEEAGNRIYGESSYEEGILTDIHLSWGDYAKYSYNDNELEYHFEGETYDDDGEILYTLLERKKQLWLSKSKIS